MYNYLSTSRVAGNSKCHNVNGIPLFAYRYLSTSRGAGNHFKIFLIVFTIVCIDTYLPREGPETLLFEFLYIILFSIDTYLPREGPETENHNSINITLASLYRYLSTSRGDENTLLSLGFLSSALTYSSLSTSGEAGNPKSSGFS